MMFVSLDHPSISSYNITNMFTAIRGTRERGGEGMEGGREGGDGERKREREEMGREGRRDKT